MDVHTLTQAIREEKSEDVFFSLIFCNKTIWLVCDSNLHLKWDEGVLALMMIMRMIKMMMVMRRNYLTSYDIRIHILRDYYWGYRDF